MEIVRIEYSIHYTLTQHLHFMIDFIHILFNLNFYAIHINAERWVNLTLERVVASVNPMLDPDWLATVEMYLLINSSLEEGFHHIWIDVACIPNQNEEEEDHGYDSAT